MRLLWARRLLGKSRQQQAHACTYQPPTTTSPQHLPELREEYVARGRLNCHETNINIPGLIGAGLLDHGDNKVGAERARAAWPGRLADRLP